MAYTENGNKIKKIIHENFTVKENGKEMAVVIAEIEGVIKSITTEHRQRIKNLEWEVSDEEERADKCDDDRKDAERVVAAMEAAKILDAYWAYFINTCNFNKKGGD